MSLDVCKLREDLTQFYGKYARSKTLFLGNYSADFGEI